MELRLGPDVHHLKAVMARLVIPTKQEKIS